MGWVEESLHANNQLGPSRGLRFDRTLTHDILLTDCILLSLVYFLFICLFICFSSFFAMLLFLFLILSGRLCYRCHKQTDHGRVVDITCIPTTCCGESPQCRNCSRDPDHAHLGKLTHHKTKTSHGRPVYTSVIC